MTKYQVIVRKILEDGTEIEEMNIIDHPFFVGGSMRSFGAFLKSKHNKPPDPEYPGQIKMGFAA